MKIFSSKLLLLATICLREVYHTLTTCCIVHSLKLQNLRIRSDIFRTTCTLNSTLLLCACSISMSHTTKPSARASYNYIGCLVSQTTTYLDQTSLSTHFYGCKQLSRQSISQSNFSSTDTGDTPYPFKREFLIKRNQLLLYSLINKLVRAVM